MNDEPDGTGGEVAVEINDEPVIRIEVTDDAFILVNG